MIQIYQILDTVDTKVKSFDAAERAILRLLASGHFTPSEWLAYYVFLANIQSELGFPEDSIVVVVYRLGLYIGE